MDSTIFDTQNVLQLHNNKKLQQSIILTIQKIERNSPIQRRPKFSAERKFLFQSSVLKRFLDFILTNIIKTQNHTNYIHIIQIQGKNLEKIRTKQIRKKFRKKRSFFISWIKKQIIGLQNVTHIYFTMDILFPNICYQKQAEKRNTLHEFHQQFFYCYLTTSFFQDFEKIWKKQLFHKLKKQNTQIHTYETKQGNKTIQDKQEQQNSYKNAENQQNFRKKFFIFCQYPSIKS
eukprot:TRINITY_DN33662_c0_g3_i1.p3 TRINITY_DN33662_c0_g3~~TRINITY_DN33662_c0_g3_i1.p3  ORF type:complete len:232 (+),score=9.93 TRINITY_DN33662_c0_g3_i1:920-1615(+)